MQISEIAKKTMEEIWEMWSLDDTWEEQHRKYVRIAIAKTIQSAIDEAAGETTQKLLMVARHLSTSCGDLHDLVDVISQIICDREINRPDERSK